VRVRERVCVCVCACVCASGKMPARVAHTVHVRASGRECVYVYERDGDRGE